MTETSNKNSTIDLQPSTEEVGKVDWKQTIELGYSIQQKHLAAPVCFHCQKSTGENGRRCGGCRVAQYCNRTCQVQDWKQGGHKRACPSYQNQLHPAWARTDLLHRIRWYTYPYAVHRSQTLGRGFLFVQCTHPLKVMSWRTPKDECGLTVVGRTVILHYLTAGEFDVEVCRDDFELAQVRTELLSAVKEYEETEQVVVLMRFRCGHMAVGTAHIENCYDRCKSMGAIQYEHVKAGSVELKLDDI